MNRGPDKVRATLPAWQAPYLHGRADLVRSAYGRRTATDTIIAAPGMFTPAIS